MLINISNHPYARWQTAQREAAKAYGEVMDMPFPNVPPQATTAQVEIMAVGAINDILSMMQQHDNPTTTIHLMGEMTFTYILLNKLRAQGIPCVASTTERSITMEGNLKKTIFKFIQFRPYY